MSEIIVGVDVGGSSTTVLVEGVDAEPRRTTGVGANVRTHGVVSAAESIARAVRDAVGSQNPSALYVGAAGVGSAERAAALRVALLTHFTGARIGVSDDTHIALRAGAETGDALVLIAGTGSVAHAEIGEERTRVGGHGHLLGDDGSGYAIGIAALRLLMRSFDGRIPSDPMLEALAAAVGAHNAIDTVARIHDDPTHVRTIAALAPIVIEHADAGERSAAKVVQGAAQECFDLLKALVRSAKVGERELPVVLAGGLFAKNSLYSYLVETRISNELPHLEKRKNGPGPEHGALSEARALAS